MALLVKSGNGISLNGPGKMVQGNNWKAEMGAVHRSKCGLSNNGICFNNGNDFSGQCGWNIYFCGSIYGVLHSYGRQTFLENDNFNDDWLGAFHLFFIRMAACKISAQRLANF